jgi:hypothetical protein
MQGYRTICLNGRIIYNLLIYISFPDSRFLILKLQIVWNYSEDAESKKMSQDLFL